MRACFNFDETVARYFYIVLGGGKMAPWKQLQTHPPRVPGQWGGVVLCTIAVATCFPYAPFRAQRRDLLSDPQLPKISAVGFISSASLQRLRHSLGM